MVALVFSWLLFLQLAALQKEHRSAVESLQKRMAECFKEARGELDQRLAMAAEDKDRQLVFLQRVRTDYWREMIRRKGESGRERERD